MQILSWSNIQNGINTKAKTQKMIKNIIKVTLAVIVLFSWDRALCQSSKPNVIIILADDLGYDDVSFNGSKDIPTPNIDRIAKSGVTFSQAYVSYAVCGPSRAGILTGRYQDRFGFSRNPLLAPNDTAMGLPLSEQTMADYLKGADYNTMAIGKWHLGAHQVLRPNKRGFDQFFGFLSGGHSYMPENLVLQDLSGIRSQFDGYKTKLLRNDQRVDEKEYLTDAFSREAVNYVARNADKPFFLYLAYNAPHAPMEATEKYLSRFEHIKDEKRRVYAAMVSAMDDGVGKVLDQLKQSKIEENTIVIFLSDNGGPLQDNGSSNAPLRGKKGNFFEGGIRVPFAMQWKGKIPENTVYTKPVISLDIFSTVASLVKNKPKNELDGVDLMPFITNGNPGYPHDYLFWRNFDREMFAVVGRQFKSIKQKDGQDMIFDLTKDISEKDNLVNQQPNVMQSLQKQLESWKKLLKSPVFLGLGDDKQYSEKYPNRYVITDNK
jgi:arylsulfatase A-like enzyme